MFLNQGNNRMYLFAKKKLILTFLLLFFSNKISAYTVVITHHYTYSTPLSLYLVKGKFSAFLKEIKCWHDKDVYFAIEEFIRLRPLNKREITSPSIDELLNYLCWKLKQTVKRVEDQIENKHRFDKQSLATGTAWLSLVLGINGLAYYKDRNLLPMTAIASILPLCLSISDFLDANNPNRDNAYLEKYKNLLKFVQELQTYDYPNDINKWFWQK